MVIRKLICGFFALVLLITTFVGCTSSNPEAIKLVPSKADFIAEVQLTKLLNDQDLIDAIESNLTEETGPQTIGEALDEVRSETGLDLRDFSRVLIFGELDTEGLNAGSEYMGIIVQGSFNEDEFIQNIEDETDEQMTVTDYKGYKLYTNDADEYSLAFFGSEMFVFGTKQAVKDTIDVKKGDREPISGLVLDAYNRLGDASITCALAIPAETRQTLEEADSSDSPIAMDVFSSMDVLGFSFNKSSDNLAIKIDLHFTDAQSATDAKDTISGLITLLKGMAQVDEVKDLLDKIEVTISDVWLNISLETTISELESLSQIFPTD